jgi:agmatine/peptidylarginine deiminase
MLFADTKTDVVFFSVMFSQRWPELFRFIKTALNTCGVEVVLVQGNFNIWARDWLPLQVGDHFVKFLYKGYGSMYEDFPWLNVPQKVIQNALPGLRFLMSTLTMDGGGIVRCGKKVVVTEKVFLDNKDKDEKEIMALLQYYFNADIIVIPIEPGDDLGHSDGIVKFVNENTILLNNYSVMLSDEYDTYFKKVKDILTNAGLKIVLMPFAYQRCPVLSDEAFKAKYPLADDNNPAVGYYVNFLLTSRCILLPVFGFEEDAAALVTIRECYPDHVVIPVDCYELSMEGGLMNCVTMNYIKENMVCR